MFGVLFCRYFHVNIIHREVPVVTLICQVRALLKSNSKLPLFEILDHEVIFFIRYRTLNYTTFFMPSLVQYVLLVIIFLH